MLSVVVHGQPVPLLMSPLDYPSACVGAEVSIAPLNRADRLLAPLGAMTLLADRGFTSSALLAWFEDKPHWGGGRDAPYLGHFRLRRWSNAGGEPRRLRLPRGHCRGFRDVHLWVDSGQRANLLLAYQSRLSGAELWYLVSNAEPDLALVWS